MMSEKENDKSSGNAINWLGVWRNQYGSTVEITKQENGQVEGFFQSALKDSNFYDEKAPIVGVYQNDMIGFAVAAGGASGSVVTYTGLYRNEKMETLWHLVKSEKLTADKEGAPARKETLDWWRAMTTSADTFERGG